jgi:hypothetical protein
MAQQATVATCPVDHTRPTQADLLFFRHDFTHAARLYAAAYAQNPTDRRGHLFLVESLLGGNNIDIARRAATAWLAGSPSDPYAFIASAEISYYQGDWAQYYTLPLKALRLDPCLPIAYSDLGDYESLNGFHSSARKHFALAHKLAPNDLSIRMQWIQSLDHTQQAQEIDNLLHDTIELNPQDRKALNHRINQLRIMLDNRCELPRITHTVVLPMTPVYGKIGIKYFALEVAFNGKKRLLQLDTGASGFLLTNSAGENLGLHTLDKSIVIGFGDEGENSVLLTRAKEVTIGGLLLENCAVDILANHGVMGGSTQIGQHLDDIDGIVGANIFQQTLVTLDYLHHQVRLDPLPPPALVAASQTDTQSEADTKSTVTQTDAEIDCAQMDCKTPPSLESWTRIYRRGHQLVMPIVLSNGNRNLIGQLFILDTGADSDMIDIHLAKGFTRYKETMLDARGLSGVSQHLSETGKLTADFAGLSLPVNSMETLDLSGFGGIAGFLGYPTLSQLVLHIDYRDNLVSFGTPAGYK